LDDEPDIPSIYERSAAPNLVVVPYFLAEGSHVTGDVPHALGLDYGAYPAEVNGRRVYYTPPVGTASVICEVIIQQVQNVVPVSECPVSSAWENFPQVGQTQLGAMLHDNGELTFGQLHITRDTITPINSSSIHEFDNPQEFRRHIRENPFRSLITGDDLPLDWRVRVTSVEQAAAVIETVYPSAWADSVSQNRISAFYPSLNPSPFMERDYSPAKIDHTVKTICGHCVRQPIWYAGQRRIRRNGHTSAGSSEHSQTPAGPRRRLQPRAGDATALRPGGAERTAGPAVGRLGQLEDAHFTPPRLLPSTPRLL
jgi:sirohydrochlorin cobaltochelatase